MTAGTLLDQVLVPGALRVMFQPILRQGHASSEIFAFECLTRGPAGTNVESSEVLFEYARRKGAERILDRACCANALAAAAETVPDGCISINIHASTLSVDSSLARDLEVMASSYGLRCSQVMIEIVEHTPVLNEREFHRSLTELRAAGFHIALDDVGLGHSNYKMMIDCGPEYLKIDRYFITGARTDRRRAAVVESVVRFAERIDSHAIAEGVETDDDYAFLRDLGIDLMQGYYFARPMSAGAAIRFAHDNKTSNRGRIHDAQENSARR